MDTLFHYFMGVIWGIDHIWQGWITSQTTTWPPTTHETYLAVTLVLGTKSFLNHGPHQWCSGVRMMTQVWICYPTISWVFIEAWTTSDRGGSTTRLQWDIQSHIATMTYSAVTLVFGIKSLNHVPHQWCSGLRMMTQVWYLKTTYDWLNYGCLILNHWRLIWHKQVYFLPIQIYFWPYKFTFKFVVDDHKLFFWSQIYCFDTKFLVWK